MTVIGPPLAGGNGGGGAVPAAAGKKAPRRERASGSGTGGLGGDTLPSPLQGTILKVAVEKGERCRRAPWSVLSRP